MDQQLFFLINREWTSPGLDLFMSALSSWGLLMIPVLALVAVIFARGGFRARVALLAVAVTVGIADGAISNPLKKAIGRPRPHEISERARIVDLAKTKPRFLALFQAPSVKMSRPKYGTVRGKSFPSSHTLDNFCVAAMLALFFRRWGWLYFPVAAMIGYSRIYTASHWPSDVVASAFLGTGIGILAVVGWEYGWRKLGPRFVPGAFERNPTLLG